MISLCVRGMRREQYPGHTEIVEDLFRIFAFLPPRLKFFPRCGNGFSTGETLTGIKIFDLSYIFCLTIRLLELLACATAVRLLRLLSDGSR